VSAATPPLAARRSIGAVATPTPRLVALRLARQGFDPEVRTLRRRPGAIAAVLWDDTPAGTSAASENELADLRTNALERSTEVERVPAPL
jgi:hypothetical protein